MVILAVYDSKAEAFLNPFFAPTRAVGVRQFEAAANEAQHQFHRFGADFTLFDIGEFDERSGKFTLHDVHENLGTALQYTTVQHQEEK